MSYISVLPGNIKFYTFDFIQGSGYFASRGKIAPCYFVVSDLEENSPSGYFAGSTKIALSL